MPRYVILFHETAPHSARPSHWDVMFEVGDVLRTWALAAAPDTAGSIEAELLADHRLAYLDYEGPISGDRGAVSRWDQGSFQIVSQSAECWEFTLRGERLVGTAVFTREPDAEDSSNELSSAAQRWTFSFGNDPSATPSES